MAGSSPSLPDGSNPSAAIVQSASDVQCSRLLKTTESIDTSSAGGRLVFHLFGALAEFEHNLIADRTRAGLAAARARGRKGGRKPKMSKGDIKKAAAMLQNPDITKTEVAEHFGVSRVTLNAALQREGYPENPAQLEPSTRSE